MDKVKIGLIGFVVLILNACTIQVDNPFYSPRSLDVNKIESKAVNNYLTQGKQTNEGR